MPMMLIRNLNFEAGLANGVGLIITGLGPKLLRAKII